MNFGGWSSLEMTRATYPSDVSDVEDMVHDLRALLRLAKGKNEQPTAAIFDGRTMQSTPESGERSGYDGHKKKKGSKIHMAVDMLGLLLVLHVTPANEQERAQVKELAEQVQEATGSSVEVAFVDQGYTGDQPAQAAQTAGMELIVVKLPEARKGFVLLPKRWVVERSFAWPATLNARPKSYADFIIWMSRSWNSNALIFLSHACTRNALKSNDLAF